MEKNLKKIFSDAKQNHFLVHLKLAQCCKSTIFQLKSHLVMFKPLPVF